MNKENETAEDTNPTDTCGGVKKPKLQEGQYGEYICDNNEWVFIPAT